MLYFVFSLPSSAFILFSPLFLIIITLSISFLFFFFSYINYVPADGRVTRLTTNGRRASITISGQACIWLLFWKRSIERMHNSISDRWRLWHRLVLTFTDITNDFKLVNRKLARERETDKKQEGKKRPQVEDHQVRFHRGGSRDSPVDLWQHYYRQKLTQQPENGVIRQFFYKNENYVESFSSSLPSNPLFINWITITKRTCCVLKRGENRGESAVGK